MNKHSVKQEPEERVLGFHYKTSPVDSEIERVIDACYDVPLLSSLQNLLKNTSVMEQVYNTSAGLDYYYIIIDLSGGSRIGEWGFSVEWARPRIFENHAHFRSKYRLFCVEFLIRLPADYSLAGGECGTTPSYVV